MCFLFLCHWVVHSTKVAAWVDYCWFKRRLSNSSHSTVCWVSLDNNAHKHFLGIPFDNLSWIHIIEFEGSRRCALVFGTEKIYGTHMCFQLGVRILHFGIIENQATKVGFVYKNGPNKKKVLVPPICICKLWSDLYLVFVVLFMRNLSVSYALRFICFNGHIFKHWETGPVVSAWINLYILWIS